MIAVFLSEVQLGEACQHNDACLTSSATCFGGTCVCISTYFDSNGIDNVGGTCEESKPYLLWRTSYSIRVMTVFGSGTLCSIKRSCERNNFLSDRWLKFQFDNFQLTASFQKWNLAVHVTSTKHVQLQMQNATPHRRHVSARRDSLTLTGKQQMAEIVTQV